MKEAAELKRDQRAGSWAMCLVSLCEETGTQTGTGTATEDTERMASDKPRSGLRKEPCRHHDLGPPAFGAEQYRPAG